MKLSDFDYVLPQRLVASHPLPVRDASRLMVLHRPEQRIEHRTFRDIVHFLKPGDALALNETKVLPARLVGSVPTGGKVELLLLKEVASGTWEVLGRPGKRLRGGGLISLGDGALEAEVVACRPDGRRIVRFSGEDVPGTLQRIGRTPLPPYLHREETPSDRQTYQTVYARVPGAVAAPTAGLHFTPELLARIQGMGVSLVPVLLHVGPGTFRPVKVEDPRLHEVEPEYYEIGREAADLLAKTRREGGRVIPVGTTTVRALESSAAKTGAPVDGSGMADAFIYPPYSFRMADALVTNFHLPRSTLLMLVSAFAGRDFLLRAYGEAISLDYRFYSFGDAMLIV